MVSVMRLFRGYLFLAFLLVAAPAAVNAETPPPLPAVPASPFEELVRAIQNEKTEGPGRRMLLQTRFINAGAASAPRLLQLLAHEDATVRAAAIAMLHEIGKQLDEDPLLAQLYLGDEYQNLSLQNRNAIIQALGQTFQSDPAADLRRMAGFALVNFAPEQLLGWLLPALHQDDPARQEEVLPILLNLAEQTMLRRKEELRGLLIREFVSIAQDKQLPDTVLEAVLRSLGMVRATEASDLALRLLGHPEAPLRAVSAFAIGEFELPELARPLGERLAPEADDRVRQVILTALARLKAPEAGPALLEFARNLPGHPVLTRMAVDALVEAGYEPAIPLFRQFLADPGSPDDVISACAIAVARFGDTQSGPILLAAHERQPNSAVLAALGDLREKQALPVLIKVLEESYDVALRHMVAAGLGDLGDAAAVPALIRGLQEDDDEGVRGQCAVALGRIGSEGSRAALEKALAEDETTHVRAYSAFALGHMGSKQSIQALRAALESPQNHRPPDKIVLINAAAALVRLGEEKPVLTLQAQTLSHHPWNRQNALIALGLTRHPSAREYILRGLTDAHPMVRHAAVTAAGDLGDPSIIPALEKARGDPYFQHDYHHGFRGYMVDMKIDEVLKSLRKKKD